jgi:hypothetical protein
MRHLHESLFSLKSSLYRGDYCRDNGIEQRDGREAAARERGKEIASSRQRRLRAAQRALVITILVPGTQRRVNAKDSVRNLQVPLIAVTMGKEYSTAHTADSEPLWKQIVRRDIIKSSSLPAAQSGPPLSGETPSCARLRREAGQSGEHFMHCPVLFST